MTDELNEHAPALPEDDAPDERGVVLIWAAFFMIAMVIMAGFAVDLGYWYFRSEQIQRAADAAALAGVAYLPGDLPGATAAANEVAARNGFTSGVTVTQDPTDLRRLSVQINDANVTRFFTSFILKNVSMTRTGKAEFARPIPLGSPENVLGFGGAGAFNRGFWLEVNGYCVAKEEGDQILSAWDGNELLTDTNSNGPQAANFRNNNYTVQIPGTCQAGAVNGTNTDYNPKGYTYVVNVPPGSPSVSLDVWDPAFTPDSLGSNDQCLVTRDDTGGCNTNVALTTTFTVHPPPGSGLADPWCVLTTNKTTNAVAPSWQRLCNPSSSAVGTVAGTGSSTLTTPGDWSIDIATKASQANSYGVNTFALLAAPNELLGPGTSPAPCSTITSSTCPQVYGLDYISPFVASGSTSSCGTGCAEFYLAQISSASAGKPLKINLWDAGDNASYLQVIDNNGNARSFTWEATGNTPFSSRGNDSCTSVGACLDLSTKNSPVNNAAVNNTPGRVGNGRLSDDLVTITVDLSGYNGTANDGWWKIRYQFPTGTLIADKTTWSVQVEANPVHLIP